MTQVTNYSVANAARATVRDAFNAVLAALRDGNSGPTAPPNPVPHMIWIDNSGGTDVPKIRNRANTAWQLWSELMGFGTAALANIGAASGNVPALITGGVLPAAVLGQGRSPLIALSGSNVDFTGIPASARRVTVMFSGLSTNGTSTPIIQLGDAGGIEISGYTGTVGVLIGAQAVQANNLSTGVALSTTSTAASVYQGSVTFDLMDATTNLWAISGSSGHSDDQIVNIYGGAKTLSQTLTQVRITTNSVNTFDAGTASVSWE